MVYVYQDVHAVDGLLPKIQLEDDFNLNLWSQYRINQGISSCYKSSWEALSLKIEHIFHANPLV